MLKVLLKYVLADFLLYDRPELSGKEALQMSKTVMTSDMVNKCIALLFSFKGMLILASLMSSVGYIMFFVGFFPYTFNLTKIVLGIVLMAIGSLMASFSLIPKVLISLACFYDSINESRVEIYEEVVSQDLPQEQ